MTETPFVGLPNVRIYRRGPCTEWTAASEAAAARNRMQLCMA